MGGSGQPEEVGKLVCETETCVVRPVRWVFPIFHQTAENQNFPGSLGFGLVGWNDSIKESVRPLLRGRLRCVRPPVPAFFMRREGFAVASKFGVDLPCHLPFRLFKTEAGRAAPPPLETANIVRYWLAAIHSSWLVFGAFLALIRG